jgi:hypothetical protein
MTEYLITNGRTLAKTWIAAPSVRLALIEHENRLRLVPLPLSSKTSDHTQGAIVDVLLGESSCIGRRENVIRSS